MLTIFYRRFYIFLFLLWLAAVAAIFVLSVWGNFDTFINDFSRIVNNEWTVNGTNSTDFNATNRGAEVILQEAEVAETAVRRKVVRDVRAVKKEVEELFDVNGSAPDPIAKQIAEDEAETNATRSASGPEAGDLSGISFLESPSRILARLQTTEKVGRITYFWMENPLKMVVDLRGKWKRKVPPIHRFEQGFISRVDIGMHPDRLRVVFNYSNSSAPKGGKPGLIPTGAGVDIVVDKTQ